MDISGSQKIKASQQRVFQAIFDPAVLKSSIPGCDGAEYVDGPAGRELALTVSPSLPGFKGPYTVPLRTEDVVEPSHLVIVTEPSSSIGSVKARCTVDLVADGDITLVNYTANAALDGKIGAIPELVLKPALKGAVDHFFKNLEKQIG
jgi:carbon monoxide dehydrogenase subunit G